eukprot:3035038-Alexandrium_andersonii.AAC.1
MPCPPLLPAGARRASAEGGSTSGAGAAVARAGGQPPRPEEGRWRAGRADGSGPARGRIKWRTAHRIDEEALVERVQCTA